MLGDSSVNAATAGATASSGKVATKLSSTFSSDWSSDSAVSGALPGSAEPPHQESMSAPALSPAASERTRRLAENFIHFSVLEPVQTNRHPIPRRATGAHRELRADGWN